VPELLCTPCAVDSPVTPSIQFTLLIQHSHWRIQVVRWIQINPLAPPMIVGCQNIVLLSFRVRHYTCSIICQKFTSFWRTKSLDPLSGFYAGPHRRVLSLRFLDEPPSKSWIRSYSFQCIPTSIASIYLPCNVHESVYNSYFQYADYAVELLDIGCQRNFWKYGWHRNWNIGHATPSVAKGCYR